MKVGTIFYKIVMFWTYQRAEDYLKNWKPNGDKPFQGEMVLKTM